MAGPTKKKRAFTFGNVLDALGANSGYSKEQKDLIASEMDARRKLQISQVEKDAEVRRQRVVDDMRLQDDVLRRRIDHSNSIEQGLMRDPKFRRRMYREWLKDQPRAHRDMHGNVTYTTGRTGKRVFEFRSVAKGVAFDEHFDKMENPPAVVIGARVGGSKSPGAAALNNNAMAIPADLLPARAKEDGFPEPQPVKSGFSDAANQPVVQPEEKKDKPPASSGAKKGGRSSRSLAAFVERPDLTYRPPEGARNASGGVAPPSGWLSKALVRRAAEISEVLDGRV